MNGQPYRPSSPWWGLRWLAAAPQPSAHPEDALVFDLDGSLAVGHSRAVPNSGGGAGAAEADSRIAVGCPDPGKSDPIDALAIARAALREPDLPVATLDGQFREVRLWWITTGTRS
jgi:hypothetical protein